MDIQSFIPKDFLDEVRDDALYEFRMVVKTLGEQISNSSSNTSAYTQQECFFTAKFYNEAQELGLSEDDAREVYSNGQLIKEGNIVREFNGYELGIEYLQDNFSGKPVITSIWRRDI